MCPDLDQPSLHMAPSFILGQSGGSIYLVVNESLRRLTPNGLLLVRLTELPWPVDLGPQTLGRQCLSCGLKPCYWIIRQSWV